MTFFAYIAGLVLGFGVGWGIGWTMADNHFNGDDE